MGARDSHPAPEAPAETPDTASAPPEPDETPEPATFLMGAVGLAGLGLVRRRHGAARGL